MEASTCLNDDSFGPDVQGCRGNFDFTFRFEQIFLSTLPSALFVVFSIPRIIYLLQRPSVAGGRLFQYSKLAASSIYFTLEIVVLALSTRRSGTSTRILLTSSSLNVVAALCISVVSFLEHAHSPRPSILLGTFLLLTLLFDITQTRSLWLSSQVDGDARLTKVFTSAVVMKAILVLIEAQHKTRWLQWDLKEYSPEETTGVYSLGALSWLNSLLLNGYKKVLKYGDLYPLDGSLTAERLYNLLLEQFKQYRTHGEKHRLAKVLAKTLRVPFLLPIAPRVILSGFKFCQPFLITRLLNFLQELESESSARTGLGLIGATILIYSGIGVSTTFYWYLQERAVFMSRACLASAVYRKTTEVKHADTHDASAITLMSTDVERIRSGLLNLHEFWAKPIEVAVACFLLQRQLGAAFVAPIVVVLVSLVTTSFVSRFSASRQKAWLQRIQKRVGFMANIIQNMKYLKVSGMADPVERTLQDLRLDELKYGSKFRTIQVLVLVFGMTPMLIAPIFTFAITSRALDATTLFTSISSLLLLTQPLTSLFRVVPSVISGFVCLQRIQNFLEKEPRCDRRETLSNSLSNETIILVSRPRAAIKILDGNFGWVEDRFILKSINAEIPAAELTIVVGPIASGKSTLCKVLLGEIPISQGQVIMGLRSQKVGYCDQVPYLSDATIRENIIGSSSLDEQRYSDVIQATMLTEDLTSLPHGDSTRVGSNGITLSGGQKQRVSLARALYVDANLFIFDDVLSGLDTNTEQHIFDRVLGPAGILRRRQSTVILCTHSIRHLPSANHILVLGSDGSLAEGTLDSLVEKNSYIRSMNIKVASEENKSDWHHTSINDEITTERIHTATTELHDEEEIIGNTRQHGDASVYRHYLKSIGLFWPALLICSCALFGFLSNFPIIWLNYWVTDTLPSNPIHTNAFYIGIYALLQGLALVVFYAGFVIGMKPMVINSGTVLHKTALRTVVTAPLRFFTTTDPGFILNFFSQDMTLIDGELPISIVHLTFDVFMALGLAAVIASSSPYILISYPIVLLSVYGIQRFYLRTSRQLRLLDLEAKSPLYTHFLDTMRGIVTFRAFGWMNEGIVLNDNFVNHSQRPAYLLAMIQRWLTFVLNIMVGLLSVLVVTLATQLRSNTGFTGASLVSLMSLGDSLMVIIYMYTQLETSLGAVSRLKVFTESTTPEDLSGESVVPPESWPERGKIEIKSVSASYGDSRSVTSAEVITGGPQLDKTLPGPRLALCNLDLVIEPGQKIAICGRSGSGKSSIILLLLRLLEPIPEHVENMVIDGLSLHTIDRRTLRQRIIAISQDTVFLPDSTSFQANLDPCTESNESECRTVLEAVNLWDVVAQKGGLRADMAPDSLSQGQRQLFSLARAILRKQIRERVLARNVGEEYLGGSSGELHDASRGVRPSQGGVLLLDEFSSGVDRETERAMQKIIQREFDGFTTIMVSHRLDMIMDFDQVLVMDAGSLVESGRPHDLVDNEESHFRKLWLAGNAG